MRQFLYTSLMILGMGTGCASQAPLPVDHYYRLPEADSSAQRAVQLSNAIFVGQLETDGLHQERAILYSEDENAIELKQYHYHHWADSPPRLIRDYLVTYLRKVNAADLVVTSLDDYVDLTVAGKIVRFERKNTTEQPAVMVELVLRLDRRNESKPLLLKTYPVTVKMEDESMQAAAGAFAGALSGIFSDFYQDMKAVLEQSSVK